MSLHTALVAIKTANSTLNSLISTRFHPDKLPQGVTLPAVRYQVISRVDADEVFNSNPTFTVARVQMDGYATTSAGRSTLRDALLGAFLGYSSASIGGESIQRIRKAGEREGTELNDTLGECYRISIDFMVPIYE